MFGSISGSAHDRTPAVFALAVLLFICVFHSVSCLLSSEFLLSFLFVASGSALAFNIAGNRVLPRRIVDAISVVLVWSVLILSVWLRPDTSLDWICLSSLGGYLLLKPKWANGINCAGIVGLFAVLQTRSDLAAALVQLIPLLLTILLANVVFLRIAALYQELESSHTLDSTTGCANRAFLQHEMVKAAGFRQRYQLVTSAVALEIPDMPSLIETLGHEKSDALLRELTQVWKSRLRNTDTLCRYSDNVFMVLAPNTNSSNAWSLAQDLVNASEVYEFSVCDHVNVNSRVIEHNGSDSWEDWCKKLVHHN